MNLFFAVLLTAARSWYEVSPHTGQEGPRGQGQALAFAPMASLYSAQCLANGCHSIGRKEVGGGTHLLALLGESSCRPLPSTCPAGR